MAGSVPFHLWYFIISLINYYSRPVYLSVGIVEIYWLPLCRLWPKLYGHVWMSFPATPEHKLGLQLLTAQYIFIIWRYVLSVTACCHSILFPVSSNSQRMRWVPVGFACSLLWLSLKWWWSQIWMTYLFHCQMIFLSIYLNQEMLWRLSLIACRPCFKTMLIWSLLLAQLWKPHLCLWSVSFLTRGILNFAFG